MCARGSPVPAARFQGGGWAWTLRQGCSGGKGAGAPRVSWQVRDAGSQGGAGAPDLLQALEHPARPPHPTWSSRHVGGMWVALCELQGKCSSSARIVAIRGKAGRESVHGGDPGTSGTAGARARDTLTAPRTAQKPWSLPVATPQTRRLVVRAPGSLPGPGGYRRLRAWCWRTLGGKDVSRRY